MAEAIKQDDINRAVWAACDTFRGTVSADIYKDYVLTLLFLKYISDVWQDHYDGYQKQYGDAPDLIDELMRSERFVLPEGASFYALYVANVGQTGQTTIDVLPNPLSPEADGSLNIAGDSIRYTFKRS